MITLEFSIKSLTNPSTMPTTKDSSVDSIVSIDELTRFLQRRHVVILFSSIWFAKAMAKNRHKIPTFMMLKSYLIVLKVKVNNHKISKIYSFHRFRVQS